MLDTVREFIRNMTVWNWLALIAFFLALVGGLNAFLSLKLRYRDWRGTKNKKEFEKRRIELANQLLKLQIHKKDPITFFTEFVYKATRITSSFLLAFFCFVAASLTDSITAMFFGALALLFSFNAVRLAFKLLQFARRMNYPLVWATEVIDFFKKAREKDLETEESKQVLLSLRRSDIFTPGEKDVISARLTREYPSLVAALVENERENS